MSVYSCPDFDNHEHISFFTDEASGLRAIVAIHSTAPFGIAGGGCRMWPYATDDDALRHCRCKSLVTRVRGEPRPGKDLQTLLQLLFGLRS